ncbi:MFS transporter [Nocardiopsis alba]|uniref:MFS transporter n=1 Tax=Nocardiopsis alba TaxID=53437 RepID=UPI0036470E04
MNTNTTPPAGAPPRAGAREWIALTFLLLPTFMMTVDLGVLWLALPALAADLGPTSGELLWINDSYGLVAASLLVLAGGIGDRIGRRRMLIIGSGAFVVASLLAAFSTTPLTLIAARTFLGLTGAAVLPSTLALISTLFADPRRRATAIAFWVTALSSGIAVGPVIGGAMVAHFWWGSVFLVGVPVMLLVMSTAHLVLPEVRDPSARPLDMMSVPLFLATLVPLVYAIKRLGSHGPDVPVIVALLAAAVMGVLFTRRQARVPGPLLEVSLLRDRTFRAALLLLFLGLAAMNGVQYLAPQYLRLVMDVPPLTAGLWLVPPALALILGSQATPVLARRLRPALVIVAGVAIALPGFAVLAGADGREAWWLSAGLSLVVLGLAPITVLGTDLAVGAAAPERAGAASALGQTAYELGLAFGIATIGTVAASIYRNEVIARAPSDLPAPLVESAADGMGGGVALAEGTSGPAGEAFVSAVRAAFDTAFAAAAWTSAGLAVLVGVWSLMSLWHLRPLGWEPEGAGTSPEAAEKI